MSPSPSVTAAAAIDPKLSIAGEDVLKYPKTADPLAKRRDV
jgi:hypothetical protein